MASNTNDLSYKSIISSFFANNKLIAQKNERIANGFRFVLDNVPVRNLSQKLQDVIRLKVDSVHKNFLVKWKQSKAKSKEEFWQNHEKWIHTDLKLPPSIMSENCRKRGSTQTKKKFEEISERQQKRRVEDLGSCDFGELLLAAVKSAKQSNQMDLHYVLKLLHNDREKASEIRRLLKANKSSVKRNNK